MRIFFLTINEPSFQTFCDYFDVWMRKQAAQRFSFAYDPKGEHQIFSYRVLWKSSSVEELGVNVEFHVIHLNPKGDDFHVYLDQPVQGIVYLSSSEDLGHIYSEVCQMRTLLPQTLFQQSFTEQVLLFTQKTDIFVAEDLKQVSQALNMTLFVQPPQRLPVVCQHVVNQCLMVKKGDKQTFFGI